MDNQIAIALTTEIAIHQEVSREALIGKYPLAPYLQAEDLMKLPEIVRAEITQSKLKFSSNEDVEFIAKRILSFINPKFESPEDFQASFLECKDFLSKSDLTGPEILIAIEMASKKILVDKDGETIKLFREIDRLKLGEIETAYINHKRVDVKYEAGKEALQLMLEPPKQKTEEEIEAERLKWLKLEFKRLQNDEDVQGSILFYDYIKSKGIETVRMSFVETVLANYSPEKVKGSIGGMPRITKNDAATHFKECLVKSYISYHKLKTLSEDEFIKHWIK